VLIHNASNIAQKHEIVNLFFASTFLVPCTGFRVPNHSVRGTRNAIRYLKF